MADQQQPISQQSPTRLSLSSRQSMISLPFIAATTIGIFLVGLSGLILMTAVIVLVLVTPVLLLVSLILVPAGTVIFLITTALLFAGGSAVAALAWIYEHMGGGKTFRANRFGYAKMVINNKARYLKEKAKDYMQYLQHQDDAK